MLQLDKLDWKLVEVEELYETLDSAHDWELELLEEMLDFDVDCKDDVEHETLRLQQSVLEVLHDWLEKDIDVVHFSRDE